MVWIYFERAKKNYAGQKKHFYHKDHKWTDDGKTIRNSPPPPKKKATKKTKCNEKNINIKAIKTEVIT